MQNVTIQGAAGSGVAIFAANASFFLDRSTIKQNSAGGVFASQVSFLRITNSTITGNSAVDGGGMYIYASQVQIFGSKIVDNTATHNGGGIFIEDSIGGPKSLFDAF